MLWQQGWELPIMTWLLREKKEALLVLLGVENDREIRVRLGIWSQVKK
jgi:hypothetical protein